MLKKRQVGLLKEVNMELMDQVLPGGSRGRVVGRKRRVLQLM